MDIHHLFLLYVVVNLKLYSVIPLTNEVTPRVFDHFNFVWLYEHMSKSAPSNDSRLVLKRCISCLWIISSMLNMGLSLDLVTHELNVPTSLFIRWSLLQFVPKACIGHNYGLSKLRYLGTSRLSFFVSSMWCLNPASVHDFAHATTQLCMLIPSTHLISCSHANA